MPIADYGLKDKIALVTGASRGIGNAIARGLSEQGAKVVLASRKQEDLEKAADDIKKAGGQALPVACHTGKLDMIKALFERIDKEFGRIDILVNNAATNPYFGDCLSISESLFDKTLEVNIKGYFFVAQEAAKRMAKQGGGAIVNIASIAGMHPPPMQAVYGMTKAAVINMTKGMAKELAPFKVRVNAICPGLTETKFAKVLIETEAIYKMALQSIPMKRHAQPEEMVGAVIYLASPAAGYTTGAVIVVDGGQTT